MDPLSITAAVVTFIDIAKRIKTSLDKISQNRKTLRELIGNVVSELLELHKLCARREGVLDSSCLDYDLTNSLDNLKAELESVLERCQLILHPPRRNRFSSMKIGFVSWLKSNEIESDIVRLKDHVTSFHRRFTYITSMRMENNLLVVNTENRARMNRMERLVARLLIDTHVSGYSPAICLDQAPRDGIEFQYLHLQIEHIVNTLCRLSSSQTFASEEPHGRYCSPLELWTYIPHSGSEASLLRITMIKALEILQSLESSSDISIQEGAYQLMGLANLLWDLGILPDAAAINTWSIDIYRTLTLHHPDTFIPYVAWGLASRAAYCSGTTEGLEAAKSAVSMYRAISDTTGEHSSDLARSLRNLAIELSINDQHEPALNAATEALMLQRQESDRIAQIQSAWIIWEARGDEVVVLSSSRSLARTQHTAFEEGLCLQQLAICLSSLKRYTEALIAANEAINCFQALVNSYPGSYERRLEEVQVNRSSWYAITNGGCTCSICLNKEAERPPIVEEIPDPEVASDVPESSKELIRI